LFKDNDCKDSILLSATPADCSSAALINRKIKLLAAPLINVNHPFQFIKIFQMSLCFLLKRLFFKSH
jgi:hypothetical protein